MSSSEFSSRSGSPFTFSRTSSGTSCRSCRSSIDAAGPLGNKTRNASCTSIDSGYEEVDFKTLSLFDNEGVPDDFTSETRNVVFVGAGYVGGPTAAVIAYFNPHINVTVVDKSEERIAAWQSKHLPIHEPGLYDVVRVARDGWDGVHPWDSAEAQLKDSAPTRLPNLFFSTDCDTHIAAADIVFLAVNTPTKYAGVGAGAATDLSMFESAARSVAMVAKPGIIIVEKSTVPCRTADVIRDVFRSYRPGMPVEVLSNPEFLAEGTAIKDLMQPSRILIGAAQTPAAHVAGERLASLYASWVPRSSILTVGLWSSELSKLVANAMLAQRISSMNTVSAICEKTGADVDDVAFAIGQDPRLGSRFLKAGLGFGGSCFKKDILSLSYLAESLDLPEVAAYWRSVVGINEWQCRRYVKLVIKKLNGSLRGKKIALLGYAFKKDTADTRESQAAEVVKHLWGEEPREIAIFDPQCRKEDIDAELRGFAQKGNLSDRTAVNVYTDAYSATSDAAAVLILTEWDQFSYPPKSEEAARASKPVPDMGGLRYELSETSTTIPGFGGQWAGEVAMRSEPDCASDCNLCADHETTAHKQANENLDWERLADGMREPKWVFDSRGLVEPLGLAQLGFRVDSLGKASARPW